MKIHLVVRLKRFARNQILNILLGKARFVKDEHGRLIRAKKPKSLGTYVALPVQELIHPVFESDERMGGRKTLDLPTFNPVGVRLVIHSNLQSSIPRTS